jgi:hypothetical protein
VLVCSQVPDTLRDHSQAFIECAKIIFIAHTSDVHAWEQDKLELPLVAYLGVW